jgi:hypothetical protein
MDTVSSYKRYDRLWTLCEAVDNIWALCPDVDFMTDCGRCVERNYGIL